MSMIKLDTQPVKIIKGEDRSIKIRVLDPQLRPEDVSSVTIMKAILPGENGDIEFDQNSGLQVHSEPGTFLLTISKSISINLKADKGITLRLIYTKDSQDRILDMNNKLDVIS